MKSILEKADCAYWSGKQTEVSDAVFDKLSAECGYVSKPPKSLKGWAQYPDYCLASPNFGLKKVSYDIARQAVRYYPKHDGIFIQIFSDSTGSHCVTRGNGLIGKDLQCLIKTPAHFSKPVNFELLYSIEDGGRVQLCADISRGFLKAGAWWLKSHDCTGTKEGFPPREIPTDWNCTPVDGWVVELDNGEKFAYKG